MRFTCIGFDVRACPWNGTFNVDETGWEENEQGYTSLVDEFGIQENEYQLLDIREQELLSRVSEYIGQKNDCNLIAVEFPCDVVKIQDERYGYNTASVSLELSDFIFRGFDVCDFNGLFSILHHPRLIMAGPELIPESSLVKALEVVQVANVLDPGHSPFVVAKVYSLK